jgi:hypothetical protein
VHALINNLVQDEAAELNTCASKAYEETLAPRHGWILRNTIYVSVCSVLLHQKALLRMVGRRARAAA